MGLGRKATAARRRASRLAGLVRFHRGSDPQPQSSSLTLPCQILVSVDGCRSLTAYGGCAHWARASSRRPLPRTARLWRAGMLGGIWGLAARLPPLGNGPRGSRVWCDFLPFGGYRPPFGGGPHGSRKRRGSASSCGRKGACFVSRLGSQSLQTDAYFILPSQKGTEKQWR